MLFDHDHTRNSASGISDPGSERTLRYSEMEGTSPPTHLSLLFDSFSSVMPNVRHGENGRQTAQIPWLSLARAKLGRLLPSREHIATISGYAEAWMAVYYELFPTSSVLCKVESFLADYDKMLDPQAQPATLAKYLLSVAITAQQIPSDNLPVDLYGGQGVENFVEAVCGAVDDKIVSSNALTGTVEGLEAAMLYVRLSMGKGDDLKGTWLTFRRLIALAEVIGLPTANDKVMHAVATPENMACGDQSLEGLKLKADLWEAICATDRNFSMMLNYPAGTSRYQFPRDETVWRNGRVSAQAYNYKLSNICASVFEIDESYARGQPAAESYEKVLRADRLIRALGTSVPRTWWSEIDTGSVAERLVRLWHFYILARIHLRPGMLSQNDGQYSYSGATCRDACCQAVHRFARLRALLPSGFFVCRMLDLQAFTVATFLLLSHPSPWESGLAPTPVLHGDSEAMELVQRTVDCLASVSSQAGGDVACEARAALTALISLVRGHNAGQSGAVTLRIPLLGTIRGTRSSIVPSEQQHHVADTGAAPDFLRYRTGYLVPTTASSDSVEGGYASSFAPVMTSPFIPWSFEFDDSWYNSETTMPSLTMTGLDNCLTTSDTVEAEV